MAHDGARVVELQSYSELRIEVGKYGPLRLRLLNGTADIFVTKLIPQIWLTFPPAHKFAVYTLRGATIEMDGATKKDYFVDKVPFIGYSDVHTFVDDERVGARDESFQGPRVIVVGAEHSGKSTLSRMLLSWATLPVLGWKPTFVDLDICDSDDDGSISITRIPGCIAATTLQNPIDPVQGIPLANPDDDLVYFYGHRHLTPSTSNMNSVELYKVLVKQLAGKLERLFAEKIELQTAGMIINTMGWKDGSLVYDDEKLCNKLKQVLKGSDQTKIDFYNLPNIGGSAKSVGNGQITPTDDDDDDDRIREYFYAIANDVAPHCNIANFNDLSMYRLESATADDGPTEVSINDDLLHLVLAASSANKANASFQVKLLALSM